MSKPASHAPAADAKQEKAAKGGSLLPKILIAGFVCSVIVAETALFFFAVPSADEVAKLAEARLIQNVGNHEEEKDGHGGGGGGHGKADANATLEFTLGEFSVPCKPGGDQRNHRIEFKLFGTVKGKNKDKLDKLFKETSGRFRHRLIMEIRTATFEELNEDQLALIQRRILAISNEVLGEPLLEDVGFESYEIYEE